MKVVDNWNSDGNIHYATVEITYNLDVSYYLQLILLPTALGIILLFKLLCIRFLIAPMRDIPIKRSIMSP